MTVYHVKNAKKNENFPSDHLKSYIYSIKMKIYNPLWFPSDELFELGSKS